MRSPAVSRPSAPAATARPDFPVGRSRTPTARSGDGSISAARVLIQDPSSYPAGETARLAGTFNSALCSRVVCTCPFPECISCADNSPERPALCRQPPSRRSGAERARGASARLSCAQEARGSRTGRADAREIPAVQSEISCQGPSRGHSCRHLSYGSPAWTPGSKCLSAPEASRPKHRARTAAACSSASSVSAKPTPIHRSPSVMETCTGSKTPS